MDIILALVSALGVAIVVGGTGYSIGYAVASQLYGKRHTHVAIIEITAKDLNDPHSGVSGEEVRTTPDLKEE